MGIHIRLKNSKRSAAADAREEEGKKNL